jgi:hypothetical protein
MTGSSPRHGAAMRQDQAQDDDDGSEQREWECEDHCDPSFRVAVAQLAAASQDAAVSRVTSSWNKGHL